MPLVFSLFVVQKPGIIHRAKIRVSAHNGERLLRQDAVLMEELIYFINATLRHYNWDYVQVIGSDGGLLKNIENPHQLPEDHRHPQLNHRLLTYLEPTL